MFLLDTDHLSILHRHQQPEWSRLTSRLANHRPEEAAVSIVSYQEQVQGWLTYINRAKKDAEIVEGYRQLQTVFEEYRNFKALALDQSAQTHFVNLRRQKVRIKTMDLRIASIALVHDATVLTRNIRDFSKVPGLKVEDWTR